MRDSLICVLGGTGFLGRRIVRRLRDHGHSVRVASRESSAQTGQPAGLITEADVSHAIADGNDVNDVWVGAVMTTRPAVVTTTSIRDTAKIMTARHFRHLPVAGDAGLLGVVDIIDVCRALISVGSHRTEDR